MIEFVEAIKNKIYTLTQKFIHVPLVGSFAKWIILGSIVGILSGTASAIFLASLDIATKERLNHPGFLFLLPLGGVFVSFVYIKFGKNSSKGNNLILEQIHDGNGYVHFRMAPLVLMGTIVTHLFGGSAGREGTAVQMGGSISEWVGKVFKVDKYDRRVLLMSGISSGFGSVFGTPLAGAIFGMEVISIGTMGYEALIPCFTASFIGNIVTTAWGIHHTHYNMGLIPELSSIVVIKVIIASAIFGIASIIFSELTHGLKKIFSAYIKNPLLKSAIGGFIIIGLVYAVGTRDYIGLGIPLIKESFEGTVPSLSFLWKTIFTTITLGTGFQGGEVTPLFVIGATLGNTLASILHISAPFLAALGLVAVFCGATNTPLASFVLSIELFGSQGMIYMFMACVISYLFSGHTGIYVSQRIGIAKCRLLEVSEDATLATVKKDGKILKQVKVFYSLFTNIIR